MEMQQLRLLQRYVYIKEQQLSLSGKKRLVYRIKNLLNEIVGFVTVNERCLPNGKRFLYLVINEVVEGSIITHNVCCDLNDEWKSIVIRVIHKREYNLN